jgi:hypothetical protein
MNAPAPKDNLPALALPLAGGFFAGMLEIGGSRFALVIAPKEGGRLHGPWNTSSKSVEGAASLHDGMANTVAMAAAGSAIAKEALAREIGGQTGWYIPALDELEVIYRNLKPTTDKNDCFMRSGINLSAMPPTEPYTPDYPPQTPVLAFQEGGEQAIERGWYWTSTQNAGDSDWAWLQGFGHGLQYDRHKSVEAPVLLVRRQLIG